jgi:uroporphyrinogen-III decarboxylase
MAIAMRGGTPDRVPVMCQLALGHYFLRAGGAAVEIWHDTPAFVDALVAMRMRYRFDGILVNLPGRDPDWRSRVTGMRAVDGEIHVTWTDGCVTRVPPDDNPHVYQADGHPKPLPRFADVDPDRLFYVEPHDGAGVTCLRGPSVAPSQAEAVRRVRERCPDVSVHGEVFSPFSQLVEWVGVHEAMLALRRDAGKVTACLSALQPGTVALMVMQARAGADAVLISSAYAGGGFISPRDYRRFVLPAEQAVIAGFTAACPDVPVYTHTCGALGDRLELLVETGTAGIDTLDPPPLGDVDLADAKARVGSRIFLKGNVDPVNTVLRGTAAECRADARRRLETAMPGGGYILSTACSVSPHAPPENILALTEAAEEHGRY